MAVVPQSAEDVFDIDDCIIHHLADRHRQAAQGHGVKAEAEPFQHYHRRQQRQGDGGAGNRRRAQIEQEQRQDDSDQHGTNEQRGLNIMGGELYEFGRTKQHLHCHILFRQTWLDLLQGLLDAFGHLQSIGPVLFRNDQLHTGLAVDRRYADDGFRRFPDLADIAQCDVGPVAMHDHRPGQLFGGDELPLALQD